MVDVVHEPIDDEQAEMQIWPNGDFCGFGLEQGSSTFEFEGQFTSFI